MDGWVLIIEGVVLVAVFCCGWWLRGALERLSDRGADAGREEE